MKMLLKIVLILVVLILAVGVFLPDTWEVEVKSTMTADVAAVHAQLSDLRNWNSWSAWNDRKDPTLKMEYTGTGVGSVETWTAEELGTGRMEITASDPATGVEYFIEFEGMAERLNGKFTYATQGDTVEVTWTGWGDTGGMPWDNVMMKVFLPMVRADFEESLVGLKAKVEGPADSADG